MKPDDILTVLVLAALAVAIVKWPRLWRLIRFPTSPNWQSSPAMVEQVIAHSYSGSGGTTTYLAEIAYSYKVNGQYYGGRSMGDLFSSEAEIDDLVAQFPKGAMVQIHVHPTRPQLSLLRL